MRKDPEALEAEKLLRRERHLINSKARYLFGGTLGILGGVGLIVLAVVCRNL
ncbi:hypothetical protein GF359_03875 [candidate division WOR-3 bacterium]|uniref:Uncharacterized protein n=1 Tax=candidate division WOR-3 bacterium TaxID=2052148 RepID=A0A9D5QDS1_UNCW3|nr:hypothetical protein [candidate division WOR-3 bacterium]